MLNEFLRLQHKNPQKVIGLMSGTSADGIDACIVEISGNGIHTGINILAFDTYPYDEITRSAILDVCNPETGTVDKICQLNFYLGKLFAEAAKSIANKAHVSIVDVDLIGSHGQTIYHQPNPIAQQTVTNPFQGAPASSGLSKKSSLKDSTISRNNWGVRSTLQIGEPSVIAQETGVTTVADFRPRDMAAGGQGAPLVPYVDFILFRSKEKGRALQNIGGIANVTFIPKDGDINEVIAFDTGPGNMIIDLITERITNGKHSFDEGGNLAAGGRIHDGLLMTLLAHPYLSKPPPKTTGREEFGKHFADTLYEEATRLGIKNPDILATVTAFTSHSIADSYKKWILSHHQLSEIILSGGGSHNKTLIQFLAQYLGSSIEIHSINTFGIASNARESITFAILAHETISGNFNNLPHATGAREAVIMGKIIPGNR